MTGINAGAAAAAVFTIVVLDGTSPRVTVGALAGALAAALAIYGLAHRRGVTGQRLVLVLVGIGITAMLGSVTSHLLTRAEVFDAHRATVRLTGSLNARGWEHVRPLGLALGMLVTAALGLGRRLRGLVARVEGARGALLLTAVGLAATATAAAGPVGFVALVAPQIARRLVGGRSLALVPAAACGALLVVGADLAGRRLFAPTELTVGIFTAVLGAPYLLHLLARANRIGTGG